MSTSSVFASDNGEWESASAELKSNQMKSSLLWDSGTCGASRFQQLATRIIDKMCNTQPSFIRRTIPSSRRCNQQSVRIFQKRRDPNLDWRIHFVDDLFLFFGFSPICSPSILHVSLANGHDQHRYLCQIRTLVPDFKRRLQMFSVRLPSLTIADGAKEQHTHNLEAEMCVCNRRARRYRCPIHGFGVCARDGFLFPF